VLFRSLRYGPEYADYVQALQVIRSIVKSEVEDRSERRKLLNAAVTEDALEEWRSASWLHDKGKLIERLRQRANYTRG
jgi:precorrin-2 dehydrogenase/sirohydrochlorin ferrochelatase